MTNSRAILAASLMGVWASFIPAGAFGAEPTKRPGRVKSRQRVTLTVGQEAPDVALWPLTATTDANGQEIMTIGDKRVRLSDYKNRAPVVIFSSSYT